MAMEGGSCDFGEEPEGDGKQGRGSPQVAFWQVWRGREEVDHVSTSGGSKRGREGETDMDSTEIEAARKTVAKALYGNLGMLMHTHRTTRRRSPGVST